MGILGGLALPECSGYRQALWCCAWRGSRGIQHWHSSARPPPPDGEVRLGPQHACEGCTGRARHAASCSLCSPAPEDPGWGREASCDRRSGFSGHRSRRQHSLCGGKIRLRSYTQNLLLFLQKLFVSDSRRKSRSRLASSEHAASTASPLWTWRVRDKRVLLEKLPPPGTAARPSLLGPSLQPAPSWLPPSPSPSNRWDLVRGLLLGSWRPQLQGPAQWGTSTQGLRS